MIYFWQHTAHNSNLSYYIIEIAYTLQQQKHKKQAHRRKEAETTDSKLIEYFIHSDSAIPYFNELELLDIP